MHSSAKQSWSFQISLPARHAKKNDNASIEASSTLSLEEAAREVLRQRPLRELPARHRGEPRRGTRGAPGVGFSSMRSQISGRDPSFFLPHL